MDFNFPKIKPNDGIVKEINELYDKGYSTVRGIQGQWWLNLAFLMGRQWVYYEKLTESLKEPKAPPWRVRMVQNEIFYRVIKELARILQNSPQIEVVPVTNEDEDIDAAKYGNRIIQYLENENNLRVKKMFLALWTIVCGTCFEKNYWDKGAGSYLGESEAGNPIRLGQVATEIVPPFEVVLDPSAKMMIEEAGWIIHEKERTPEYIESRWNVKVKPDSSSSPNLLEGKIASLVNAKANETKETVRVREFWQLPCGKYPKGRFAVIANDKVLEGPVDFPYDKKELPFVPYISIPVLGRFWGSSKIEFSIPIQKEINKTLSQIIEAKNLMSRPKWVAVKGMLDEPPTDEPGELVEYNPFGNFPEPKIVSIPGIPNYVFNILDRCVDALDNIWAQHEISKGQTPPNVESGVAIQFLQEADLLPMGVPTLSFEESSAKGAAQRLSLVAQYYKEARVIKTIGEDRKVETFDYSPNLWKKNTDVRVRAGSGLPQSKSARQAFFFQLWRERVITDNVQLLKLMEFSSFEQLYREFSVDSDEAKTENNLLLTGKNSIVQKWQNHTIHLYEHNKLRKSAKYQDLNDGAKAIIDGHANAHEDYISAKLAEAVPGETPNIKTGTGGIM